MSEADRISPDQDDSVSSEPLGIKEPLRSPTALGQSRFLMPLGLRSLSVLQPIAVHPQVDDFDFSSIQTAEPTHFQEPESPPNLQLSSLSEPKDLQSALFEIPTRDCLEKFEGSRPSQINSLQQKQVTSSKSHPGTSLPRPVQGVVKFFKSVFGRQDSPVPEETSTPESLSVANSPQSLSEAPSLIQPQWDDATAQPDLIQATLSSELASPAFFDPANTATSQILSSNVNIQQRAELQEDTVNQTVSQQFSVSNGEMPQRAKDEGINASKDANFPFVSDQAPLQKNVVSLPVDNPAAVLANDLDAIAPTQLNSENTSALESQRISSENFLIPASSTLQLQQQDKLEQELLSLFPQDEPLSENSISSSETTTVETNLEKSLNIKEVSSLKNELAEPPQIQRQSADQSTDSVQPISSVQNSTGNEQSINTASDNQQIIQTQDYLQPIQALSVIYPRNNESKNQDQTEISIINNDIASDRPDRSATDSIFPLLNHIEINTLQAKQENSLGKTSYSVETDAIEQPESIQSAFPLLSTQAEEIEAPTSLQQLADASAENEIERAIAFIPENFTSGIKQQETSQPSLQLRADLERKEDLSTEISESFLEFLAPAKPLTPASSPQLQQNSVLTKTTTASHQITSPATLPVSQSSRDEEPTILQKRSDTDISLNPNSLHDASAISEQAASSIIADASPTYDVTSTYLDESAPNLETFLIPEDASLTHYSPSSTINNYDIPSGQQERLVDSSGPDVLQLREEKEEIRDLPFIYHDIPSDQQENWVGDTSSNHSPSSTISYNATLAQQEKLVNAAAPPILQLQAEKAEILDFSFQEAPQTLLPKDLITSAELSPQAWDVEVVSLASPEIQRQVENVRFPDTAGAAPDESLLPKESASLEDQLESKNTAGQDQSDVNGDRAYESFIPAHQNSSEPIPDVSIRSASPQELDIQRHPAPETTQTTIQKNSDLVRPESHPGTFPDTPGEVEAERVTVSSEFVEQEGRSLQPISGDSPLPQNAPITENIASLEIQRQVENPASESIVTKHFSDVEAESHSESEFIEREERSPQLISNESRSPQNAPITENFFASEIQRQTENPANESVVVDKHFSDVEAESHSESEYIGQEGRSPQPISNEPPLPQNAPRPENLSSPQVQRQTENSVSASHVVPKDFSDTEAENRLENEILSTSVNDSDGFTEPSLSASLQPEEHSESGILSTSVNDSGVFIESSTPNFLQLKSERVNELAVPSHLQNISVAESFEHRSESVAALNYPGSKQHFLKNTFEPSAQLTNNVPAVQATSANTNDTEETFNSVEESISESIEFVPDPVASFSTETAIALSTSEPLLSASHSNPSESSAFSHPLIDSIPNSSNVQRRIEPSEPVIQNPTPPSNGALQAETHLEPALQGTEQSDNSLQNFSGASRDMGVADLHQSLLDLENRPFHAESAEAESLSSVQPSSLALGNVSEDLSYPTIQLEQYSNDERNFPQISPSSEPSQHGSNNQSFVENTSEPSQPKSDNQSFVENTSDALNQFVAEVPTIQAASMSSSSASTKPNGVHRSIAVEARKLNYFQPDSDAIAQEQQPETSQGSILPEDRLAERAIASHPLEDPDPLTVAGKREPDSAIQQRPIEPTDLPLTLAESETSSQVFSSIPVTENLSSSAGEQQSKPFETDSHTFLESSPSIQQSEHFETDGYALSASSSAIQLDSESHSQDDLLGVPLSDRPVDYFSASPVHPGSDIQRFIDGETIADAEHENAISQSSPDIQLELEDCSSGEKLSPELSDLSERSVSDAIAQPLSESAIFIPPTEIFSERIAQPLIEPAIAIPATDLSSEAIGKAEDAPSSYESTPNGRRDAQVAALESQLPVEGVVSSVLQSDIQCFVDDSFEHASSSAQTGSSELPETVNLSSPQLFTELPQLPRFLQDLTVLKPLVQRSPLTTSLGSVYANTLDELPLSSSSEAIVQTTTEPAIEFSSLLVEPLPIEPSAEAIAKTWDASSSYNSTPNGRRDAQIAASENPSSVESRISQVLPNSLSSDIQRFIDSSSEHSSFSTQPGNSDHVEAVSSSSQFSADLPQLPRFLQDLTVLKPLVQRSLQVTHKGSLIQESSEELADSLGSRSGSNATPRSSQNSSAPFPSPFSGSQNSATLAATAKPIAPIPLANIQPASTSAQPAQTPSSAPISAHPGTAPSAWSSLAELANPKPSQPQQSSTNHYSPLAPSLIQAKFAIPTLQKAIDSNAPVEVSNAPTTTLSASDFQPETPLDALLETLAQEIYGLLRQKMEIERERQGRSLGRMPW